MGVFVVHFSRRPERHDRRSEFVKRATLPRIYMPGFFFYLVRSFRANIRFSVSYTHFANINNNRIAAIKTRNLHRYVKIQLCNIYMACIESEKGNTVSHAICLYRTCFIALL